MRPMLERSTAAMKTLAALSEAIARVESWGGLQQDAALAQSVANLRTAFVAHEHATLLLIRNYKHLAAQVNDIPETHTTNDPNVWRQLGKP